MGIPGILYYLIIFPLRIVFEYIYGIAYGMVHNYGIAIVFLSLAVSLLILPLYRRADALQREEQDREDAMKEWVDRIKAAFKGDERYMMLSAYYREQHYSPLYQMNSAISTLLQIPFLLAAYSFLSGYSAIRGVSFGPIRDLGAPDGLLVIGTVTVNVLPVIMTLVNLLSGIIYTKGQSLRNKIQVIAIALVFLFVLYRAPAGLALYWTLNNVFSLVKNIFYRLRNPEKVLKVLMTVLGAGFIAAAVLMGGSHLYRRILFIGLGLILLLPVLRRYLPLRQAPDRTAHGVKGMDRADTGLFFTGAAFLFVLTGLLIPSGVLASSPQELMTAQSPVTPIRYMGYSGLLAAGTFLIWAGVFYYLAKPAAKKMIAAFVWVACAVSVVDYMFFGTALGSLNVLFQIEFFTDFTKKESLVNLAVVLAVALCAVFLYRYKRIVRAAYLAAFCGFAVLLIMNVRTINAGYNKAVEEAKTAAEQPEITLSDKGKNVMVIILDRAVSRFVPFMLEEKPELAQMLDGFTYYPNTVSFGGHTIVGMPPLWGGYEYTPDQMQLRPDESMKDKHDEALKVMPKLFSENGFGCTVFDAPYAGYSVIPDLSIYNDVPDTSAYISEGYFSSQDPIYSEQGEAIRRRNLFCYSIFKIVPCSVSKIIYNKGRYQCGLREPQKFLESYTVLTHMKEMTKVSHSDKNQFFIMENHSTHACAELQRPDYVPVPDVNNEGFSNTYRDASGYKLKLKETRDRKHYHSNIASLLALGEYFEYLRENDLYDNTKIIIVSDHGSRHLFLFDDMYFEDIDLNVENYNPVLMVKDFNASGFRISDEFMTQADVPTLCADGLIDDPVNPYTGNPITDDAKDEDLLIFQTSVWRIQKTTGNTFDEQNTTWFRLKNQDLFKRENWVIEKSTATSRHDDTFKW